MVDKMVGKFWKQWEERYDKDKFIEERIVKGALKGFTYQGLSKKLSERTLAMMINSYFEDLFDYATSKKPETPQRKKKRRVK